MEPKKCYTFVKRFIMKSDFTNYVKSSKLTLKIYDIFVVLISPLIVTANSKHSISVRAYRGEELK